MNKSCTKRRIPTLFMGMIICAFMLIITGFLTADKASAAEEQAVNG